MATDDLIYCRNDSCNAACFNYGTPGAENRTSASADVSNRGLNSILTLQNGNNGVFWD